MSAKKTFYQYIQEETKKDADYEKKEKQREIKRKEERNKHQLEGSLFLFDEDKADWISKKYRMPSYQNKSISMKNIIDDIHSTFKMDN